MKKTLILWIILLGTLSLNSLVNAYIPDSIKTKMDNLLINVHNKASIKDDSYKVVYYNRLINIINSLKEKYKTWAKREVLDFIYDDINEKLDAVSDIWINVDTEQDKCYDDKNQIVCPWIGFAFYGQDDQLETTQPYF